VTSTPELDRLYRSMVRMRALEEAVADLWRRGLVSGELHLGVGEEGVIAGVTDHLTDGDAVVLDYRPTPALAARGVDLSAIVLEVLGDDRGLGGAATCTCSTGTGWLRPPGSSAPRRRWRAGWRFRPRGCGQGPWRWPSSETERSTRAW
jgi:hypothetical protein